MIYMHALIFLTLCRGTHVFGAGHLRRPPLLSVFDITLKTFENNIIDEGGWEGWGGVRGWWGGVGWGGIIASFAARHALAHIRHATPLYVLMRLHTYVMLRRCTFSCTCTHTSCYAAVRSHALAHIRHATLLYVLMRLHTYVMLRGCTFSCTCTHTSCYAAVRSHALAHIRHATLLYVLMHLHTYVMLRCCTFSCTCTHTSCYAAVRSHALAHIRHATLLYVLMRLHTYVMLRCCTLAVRFHDDDDDDDDEIAPDAKVSFFSLLWSPLSNVWEVTTAGASSDARRHVFETYFFEIEPHGDGFSRTWLTQRRAVEEQSREVIREA